MENLSYSKLKLPKKPASHNAAANNSGPLHKSIYDDVFGGPPKMGVPTFLSPRVEDYGEIFGGFHAPRASGIPVLDLPLMEEDEVDIGNGRLDYMEVFGGCSGLDFANGYEELVRELSHGGGNFTDEDEDDEVDEAWTPAGSSGCLSEISDHSGSNRCVSNGDSCHSFDGNIEYNICYHKSNPGSDLDAVNGIRHAAPTHAAHGFSYVVDESSSFQKSGMENLASQRSDYDNYEMDSGHETIKRKHLRKTTSHPMSGNVYGQQYAVDIRPQREYGRIKSFPNETFVTISEVSLRTDPTHLPPPSRLPPALDGKGGDAGRLASKWKVEPSEESKYENLPAFFDVEVDVGSSVAASASAAAMKEAMEKAQARLKSAKELMERKKEGLQAQTKEVLTNDFKDIGGKGNKIASGTKSVSNVLTRGPGPIESNSMRNPCTEEAQRLTKTKLGNPDIEVGERMLKDLKGPSKGVQGKYPSSSQMFNEYEETDEWKEASQFFELVKADKLRGPVELGKEEKVFLQNGNNQSHAGKEGIVGRETFDRLEYDCETKATGSHGAERIGEKENSEGTNKGRLKAVKVASRQKQDNMAQKILEPEETEKKFKVASPPEGFHEKLEKDDSGKLDSLDDIQIEVDGFEIRHVKVHKDDRKDMNVVSGKAETIVKHATEQKQVRQNNIIDLDRRTHNNVNIKDCCGIEGKKEGDKEALEWEEKERRFDAAFRQAENENRQREILETEENTMGQKENVEKQEKRNKKIDSFEREENGKRSKRVTEWKENEKRSVEVSELEDQVRLRKASECEENDRREKEAYLQKERQMKETCEKEVVETRLPERKENMLKEAFQQNEAHQREEVEKIFEESQSQENNQNLVKEAYNREVNEDHFEKSREIQKKEKSQKETTKCEENNSVFNRDITKESNLTFVKGDGLEEINWDLQEETVLEEIGDKVCGDSNVRGLNDQNEANMQSQKDDFQGHAGNNDNSSGAKISEENSRIRESIGRVFVNARNETVCAGAELNGKNSEKAVTGNLGDSTNQVSGLSEGELKNIKNQIRKESAQEPLPSDNKAGETAVLKEQTNIKATIKATPIHSQHLERNSAQEIGGIEKNINQSRIPLDQNEKEKFASARLVKEEFAKGREKETAQPAIINPRKTSQHQNVNAAEGRQEKMGSTKSEDKKTEKLKRQEELENEHLRKLEEEREREREREKDRMAVDWATLEAQERSYAEARERAERAAMEKATTDARQRAMAEARERLEKACAEARERSFGDKASAEARLRAERAAVERATAEARERAAEKAASSRYVGTRPTSSDVQDRQYQNPGSSDSSRYQHSFVSGSYIKERFEGVEGESAQRCKARLERHRRTAERAAKALAEKNMRDLIAQREHAERNRLAESLDADVKRWSSGKEGNLRALLSTLQYILGPESGWQPIPLTEVITSAAVKKAYRKATLCVHPDKLQQRGASIQQKYICEKVFDLLKEAWNKFNSEER